MVEVTKPDTFTEADLCRDIRNLRTKDCVFSSPIGTIKGLVLRLS